MSDEGSHPSDASYEAGVTYAKDNAIPLTDHEVRAYARAHVEDAEAFVDGYWNTKKKE